MDRDQPPRSFQYSTSSISAPASITPPSLPSLPPSFPNSAANTPPAPPPPVLLLPQHQQQLHAPLDQGPANTATSTSVGTSAAATTAHSASPNAPFPAPPGPPKNRHHHRRGSNNSNMPPPALFPPASPDYDPADEQSDLALNLQHDHKDLVQAVAFNTYGDRCATGSVDGKIRVFNRHKDGVWRLCDKWGGHGGEVLELQWLPATVYPNLVASLGIEGRFKLWAEDPSAAPGRRFHNGGSRTADGKPSHEMRSSSPRYPYRSFSVRYAEDTRLTHLALLTTEGRVTVFESDEPERLTEVTSIDDFAVREGWKPARGEEISFKVRFDPNPEPCYTALRAGLAQDSLGMVVAAMSTVFVYRSQDVEVPTAYGISQLARRFVCVAKIEGHRGLIRDVAWAPGNFKGYDVVATACQDGLVRVFKIETDLDDAKRTSWPAAELSKHDPSRKTKSSRASSAVGGDGASLHRHRNHHPQQQTSGLSASFAKSGSGAGSGSGSASGSGGNSSSHGASTDRTRLASQVATVATEIAKLDAHDAPVWRVGFDDDGQILGSSGDDGRLMCFRQRPDGTWAKSSELGLVRARMAVP